MFEIGGCPAKNKIHCPFNITAGVQLAALFMALAQRNTAKGAAVLVRCRQRTGKDRILMPLEGTIAEHGFVAMGI
ncbi:hypothetical protein D3C80_1602650 [compost metagenome]